MKGKKIFVLALVMVLLFCTSVFAQKLEKAETGYIDQAQEFMVKVKDAISKLRNVLKEAREQKDTKKIECVDKRLVDIEKLAAEIEAHYQKMWKYSLNKQIPEMQAEYDLITQKRQVIEQLLKLVNECLQQEFTQGYFTETVQELLTLLDQWIGDPTATPWEPVIPEPLPPEYEPRPPSLADEE